MLTQRPRGTADILPGTVEQWQFIENRVRETFHRYHYQEIRTPIFEHTELFQRGVGETTDIVAKEMYTFSDRGDRSLTLRPEGTAGVVRAYVENKLYGEPHAVKLYYMGPMFRYEKPQKGRWRQFHQYGCEVFGADTPAVDAEVIGLNRDILMGLGIKDLSLELNSVGCSVCRPVHKQEMMDKLLPVKDRLCKDCQERLERNPLRIFDCKHESCQHVLAEVQAPTVLDALCGDCHTHFEGVKKHLSTLKIPFVINAHLVRGLDYYTRTAWEFTVPGFSSVAGGGRYNALVAQVGGPETPGIGFAGGMERAVLVLEAQQAELPKALPLNVFVAVADDTAEATAMILLQQCRQAGLSAERDYLGRGLKAQLKMADRMNAAYVLLLGESEIQSNSATVKELATGEQSQVNMHEVVSHLLAKEIQA